MHWGLLLANVQVQNFHVLLRSLAAAQQAQVKMLKSNMNSLLSESKTAFWTQVAYMLEDLEPNF